MPFSIAWEDTDLMVVNKPAGISIHPAPGHPADTLANGLAWHYGQLGIPFVFRCINRLDRDTTGLLIVAKHVVSASILETALHQPIGDPGTLLEQLRLLLELGAQDTVEIRVIPNSAGWTPAHSGDFFLLEFSKAAPVVHLEHHRGSVFLQSESDVAAFVRARDEVDRVAMSCADSAELITGIIARARAA